MTGKFIGLLNGRGAKLSLSFLPNQTVGSNHETLDAMVQNLTLKKLNQKELQK